jgi:hypothetical protein
MLHHLGRRQAGVHRAPEVHRHRVLEIDGVHGLDGTHLDDAGVVDQDVQPPEAAYGGGHHVFDLLAVGDVADLGKHLGAPVLQVQARAVQLRRVPRADGDAAALLGQLARQQHAQPARAARDQGDLAAQADVPGAQLAPGPVAGGRRPQRPQPAACTPSPGQNHRVKMRPGGNDG